MPKLKRINARISIDLDHMIQELAHAKGVSISDIVVTALKDLCAKQAMQSTSNPYEKFRKAGLIGCFRGGKSLSRNYKKAYSAALDQKWPK